MWNPFKKRPRCSFNQLREYVYYEYHYRIAVQEKHEYMRIGKKHYDRLMALRAKYSIPYICVNNDEYVFYVWSKLRTELGKQIPELLE